MAVQSDLGGRPEFFGPVGREVDEPVFHHPWEGRVFGISLFVLPLLGRNIDAFRFAQERLTREMYLSGYYQRWLFALEDWLSEVGYLGPGEVDARLAARRPEAIGRRGSPVFRTLTSHGMGLLLRPRLPGWFVRLVLPRILSTARKAPERQRFSVGDRVRVRDTRAPGHTRQPGYVTGKPGEIVTHLGAHVFPDSHAVGRRTPPQHLYTVAFEPTDLWGDAAEPGTETRVDLYESYLEPL